MRHVYLVQWPRVATVTCSYQLRINQRKHIRIEHTHARMREHTDVHTRMRTHEHNDKPTLTHTYPQARTLLNTCSHGIS